MSRWLRIQDVEPDPEPVRPEECGCGDARCRGRLVITLHDAHAGPEWMLTFRG